MGCISVDADWSRLRIKKPRIDQMLLVERLMCYGSDYRCIPAFELVIGLVLVVLPPPIFPTLTLILSRCAPRYSVDRAPIPSGTINPKRHCTQLDQV